MMVVVARSTSTTTATPPASRSGRSRSGSRCTTISRPLGIPPSLPGGQLLSHLRRGAQGGTDGLRLARADHTRPAWVNRNRSPDRQLVRHPLSPTQPVHHVQEQLVVLLRLRRVHAHRLLFWS